MAIVEMKKVRLLALKRDRGRILSAFQRLRCVHVAECEDAQASDFPPAPSARREELEALVARLDWAIARVSPYDPIRRSMFALKPEMTEEDLIAAQASRADVLEIVSRLEEIERTFGELRTRAARENAQIISLKPWEGLDAPLEGVGETAHSLSMLLSVPARAWKAFDAGLKAFAVEPEVEEISRDGANINAFIAVHRLDAEALDALVRETGAVRASFAELRGTPAANIGVLSGRLLRIREVQARLQGEIEGFGARTQELKLLRDALALECEQLEAATRSLETESAFLLTAWTPAACVERVRKAVERAARDCDLEFLDPAEDEQPPTELQNGPYVSPFESVVKMYSLPDPRGIDPTCVMMPFFICYFGLMVSDAAYGIIMGIVTGLLTMKLRGKGSIGSIVAVLFAGSIGTVIWGALLGGWFGIEDVKPLIGFTPMGDPIKMMVLCLGLGAVQLLTGIGVAMYMNFRRGHVLDGLLDQGLWFVLFAGLGLLFVSPEVGKYVAIAGAAGIFFTAGRKRKNVFSRLVGGFSALYGISGYVSDLLSYARLFGMGLATGVIAMVFNNVAGMFMNGVVGTIAGILILVVGHAFNLGINALGAYVHTCRLQYIEFFGKFYEDGGKPFKPLTTQGKYVDFGLDKAA